jgi:hypothetical protein
MRKQKGCFKNTKFKKPKYGNQYPFLKDPSNRKPLKCSRGIILIRKGVISISEIQIDLLN